VSFDPRHPAPPESSGPGGAPPSIPAGPTATPTAGRSSGSRVLNIVLGIAVAVAIGGVAFAVGRTTAPVSAASPAVGRFGNGQFPSASGAPAFGNGGQAGDGRIGGPAFLGRGNGLTMTGTVDSIAGGTMTITTEDGQTIELILGPDTTYSTKTAASASEVTEGSTVEVQIDVSGGFRGGLGDDDTGNPDSTPSFTANGVTVVP
jgi:hypothetical protein